ncbi:DUF115 domain-containing protein [Bacillus luteolus]|uniref:DUF115 domain-containing protein n=1 Tax=Litchfieldia luteola TaxID=682179 RepID=A0ABR9QFN8_9BACI|nr:6-hydroxymethylpterin diphosphokinase MptE-like protein [Cytobacillus luteolus]MBE4907231.1 DUF115 domain-containing protein [Cytobacillus luteolus]MBP1943293.1 hypothetical protein [Cytobacillus luteolus]
MKKLIKHNKYVYSTVMLGINLLLYIIYIFTFNSRCLLRVSGFNRNTPYEKIKRLKDKHKGERCFIVATGPSLLVEDLEKIKDEITFSMNSIFMSFDETTWRPTYYGIQFPEFYEKYKNQIDTLDVKYKLVGDVIKRAKLSDHDFLFPLNMLNHNWTHAKYHTKFSSDAFKAIYSGYTITYSLIQLAVYMGFREIYLVGVDCNYATNQKHHFKDYGIVDPSFISVGDKMRVAFQEAKRFADAHEIKIYNATRGGMLEVFERVDLDSLIEKERYVNYR